MVDSKTAQVEFFRWYGPWAPLDPRGVAGLLAGFDRPWWVVGGWAMSAFSGAARRHEDVDVSILACDIPALRGYLGQSWTPWSNAGGVLRPLSDRFPEPLAVDGQIWLRRNATSPWEVDMPITPDQGGLWTNKRMPQHVAPIDQVTWLADDGIRYLNAEIALLFKASQDRGKDRRDLAAAWPLLSVGARSWLLSALAERNPEHVWLRLLHSDEAAVNFT